MDLSKAFDCLSHSLVIAKRRAYGLELPACKLLFSYLRGRKQRVKISNSRSSWAVLKKGVSQGSILGLSFLIFSWTICSFSLRSVSYTTMRTSGLRIVVCKPTLTSSISCRFLPNLQHSEFCEYVTTRLSEAEVKVLGVTIDHKLCFSQHISACGKKAARQLNALARISKHLNINSRRAIYNSFIMSNFNYCPLVWHFGGQVNNQKLEKNPGKSSQNTVCRL